MWDEVLYYKDGLLYKKWMGCHISMRGTCGAHQWFGMMGIWFRGAYKLSFNSSTNVEEFPIDKVFVMLVPPIFSLFFQEKILLHTIILVDAICKILDLDSFY